MKKGIVLILVVVVGLGCRRTNLANPPGGLRFEIGNTKWVAAKHTADGYFYISHGVIDSVLGINAFDSINKQHFSFTIHGWNEKTGIYNYSPSTSNKLHPYFFFESDLGMNYNGISGEVTITKLSANNIQGTFNAVMKDTNDNTITFNNGSFNIPYDAF